MSEYGRGRRVEDGTGAGRGRLGSHGEESERKAGGRENNVAGPDAACVILAEQSAPNATRVVADSGFRPVKMVDRLPSYLT